MPEAGTIFDILFLRQYNTRVVVICVVLLGCAAGLLGSFLLLRKRSLMGDVLSHATLPGIGLAFMAHMALGGDGKSLPVLLAGAAATGVLGSWAVLAIRNNTRIKDDAAMGIVLSVFFGLGIAVRGLVQDMATASAAGLDSFIYGKPASMVSADFQLLAFVATAALMVSLLFYKEFRLICFDEAFAAAQGWPVRRLDILLLALITAVTVAGLQAVGLILIIAFLITPASAARFWTHRLGVMLLLSGVIGGVSGWLGAGASALYADLPTGPMIVLAAGACFGVSLLAGAERGVLVRAARQRRLRRKIARQHLLRAIYEILEAEAREAGRPGEPRAEPVPFRRVRGRRTWSDARLRKAIRQAYRDGLVDRVTEDDAIVPTERGLDQAAQVTRNHRLWEMYLIEYADVATSRVDRDADAVEHVLGTEMVRRLEAKLKTYQRPGGDTVPESPHPILPGD